MPKRLHISIPSPCHENWTAMIPVEKGRFCGSCQKAVHDFTQSSDREISALLAKEPNACGRFLNTQLNRDIVVPKDKSSTWMAASAAVVSLLVLGTNEAIAQQPISTEQQHSNDDEIMGKVAPPAGSLIKGTVVDELGNTFPGAVVRNITLSEDVFTDANGNFSIFAKKGHLLEISSLTYCTNTMMVDKQDGYLIKLEADETTSPLLIERCRETSSYTTTGAVIVISETFEVRKRRTFLGRILHSVDNLFR
jgi:hypothetical protein